MMAQTGDGFIWFATRKGLYRFDGVRFERYESRSGAPIQAAHVTAIHALPQNGLAIGWPSGATLLRDGHAVFFAEEKEFPVGLVLGFALDGSGTLWAAANGGLARFDGKRWQRIGEDWNFRGKRTQSLFVDRDGTLGVFTETTLMTLPKGATSFHATGGEGSSITPIVQAPSGVYVYCDGPGGIRPIDGLNEYDRIGGAWHLPADGRRYDGQTMLIDRDGGLWFGAAQGVGRVVHPEQQRVEVEGFGDRDELAGSVTSILEDRDGSIWVATAGGVNRFRASRFTVQLGSENLQYPPLMPEPNGAIRFGGFGRDLLEMGTDGVLRRIAPIGVNCAYRDADGNAWYCSVPKEGKGPPRLFRESDGRMQQVPLPDGIEPLRHVGAVTVDADRKPWISLESQGIFRREESGWRLVTELRRGGKLHSLVLTTDPSGGVWIGYSWDRVARWKDGVVRNWEGKDGLNLGHVMAVLANNRHVWAGGEKGLALLDGERFRSMAVSNPEVLLGLTGIVETKAGDLWLHGLAGAVFIEAREVQRAIEQPGHIVAYRLFDSEDGLVGQTQGLSTRPSLVEGPDGRLWFGTIRGVYVLDPSKVTRNPASFNVVIDAALAGDSLHLSPAELSLPALTTTLRVDYTAPSLIMPRRVQFRYKLDGVDQHWRDAGTLRQAFYTSLGPGHYRFHVTAANEDGVWNEQGASFSFSIAPAWHQSRWFYLLCAATILAALAMVYRARGNQIRRQTYARLQERLLERERIARELHDTLLQGFQGLIMTFGAATRRIPPEQAPRPQMEEALARADDVLAEGRERIRGLRESIVDQGDLRSALSDIAADLAVSYPIPYAIHVEGAERQLHPVVLEDVYGIAREVLANAFRHANARHISVEVQFGKQHLGMRIADDGKGIAPDVLANGGAPGHWGLTGIRERAAKLGSKLQIRSAPKSGTIVQLEVPAAVAYRHQHEHGSWWRRIRRSMRRDS